MITKLIISNENEFQRHLEGSSEDFFIEAYCVLHGCLDVKNNIPLDIVVDGFERCELTFKEAHKKTKTYCYEFIVKDF